MNLDAIRAVGAAHAAPAADPPADWSSDLRERFDSRYAARRRIADEIASGKRDPSTGLLAKTIIRQTKHAGTRAAFQCPTCRAIGTRVGQCDGCRRSYAA